MSRTMFLDLETYAPLDLKKVGTGAYAPVSTITCAAYAIDDEDVVFAPGNSILCVLDEKRVDQIVAHSAGFDVAILEFHGWHRESRTEASVKYGCTMAMARLLNLPAALNDLAGLLLQESKLSVELPSAQSSLWGEKDMEAYVKKDVELCRDVYRKLSPLISNADRRHIHDDIRINLRGLPVDQYALAGEIGRITEARAKAVEAISKLCPVANSPEKFLAWLQERGHYVVSTGAVELSRYDFGEDETARKACSLVSQIREPELAKLEKMVVYKNPSNRLTHQFVYAAAQTARWSSRGIQLHNLKRGSVARSVIKAAKGTKFYIADYAQIELRITLWLAGEHQALSRLAEHDLYMELARKVYGADAGKQARHRAKIVLLAAQYGAGWRRIAAELDSNEAEARKVLEGIHAGLPRLRQFARELYAHIQGCVSGTGRPVGKLPPGLEIGKAKGAMYIKLPTGRTMWFHEILQAHGEIQFKHGGYGNAFCRAGHGGKWLENVSSGIARDFLARSVSAIEKLGCSVLGHIHDEVIVEVAEDAEDSMRDKLDEAMIGKPLPGLPIAVESRYADSL